MSIRLYESNGHKTSTLSGIADNSMVLDGAYFLQQTSGIVEKATAGARIIWVNTTQSTFASDNETVAKKRVEFVPTTANRLYEVEITILEIDSQGTSISYTLTITKNQATTTVDILATFVVTK